MLLFQKSVLNKYLKSQDEEKIVYAFEKLKIYQSKAEKISEYKEEEYQDGFLRDVFVNVLGFTYKYDGNDTFNLLREKKNVSDSKKADGAIIKEEEVFCVIELKDTTTKDLIKVETQAFGYQSGHVNCNYVIISNFEKLNFYIKNKVDKAEFNLFTATFEEFKTIYLCLHADNLLNDVPLKVKEASLLEDEKVTKGLYKDYSAFKNALWENLCNNHPEEDTLFLFKKTQKLLDRFLFIFFGEDKGLLPPNSISKIIAQWEQLKELDEYKPLYERFKKYFGYLNTGWKGKEHEIFAYNGGLFSLDELLDKIQIDDDVLHPHVMNLTAYDFESDVDVNILGHIFEHSLNEIENITAKLEGREVDKGKTKRKKDGVFYTPKYITKYIVENTFGKLCLEKKEELYIVDEEYSKGRKNRKKTTIKILDKNLQIYRDWLLQITICDPACGSGAFLNQALESLMKEHKYIDELESQLLGYSFEFPGVENHILENNLYGVDINEESVEIAKLSLWLRTAQKGRKLTSLNNNIKCGNSLIDDLELAGDKAFDWKKEFPEVFAKRGFDVVIGNPPYVQIKNDIEFFNDSYSTALSGDLYAIFFERSLQLLNNNGLLGFITPSSYMTNIGFLSLREQLLKYRIDSLIDLGSNVFKDASVDSAIIILTNKLVINNKVKVGSSLESSLELDQNIFLGLTNKIFNIYLNPRGLELCNNLEDKCLKFSDYINFARGVEFGFKSDKILDDRKDETYYPILCGGDISKQLIDFDNKFIKHDFEDSKIYKSKEIYSKEKVLVKRIGNQIIGSYDNEGYHNVCDVYNLQLKNDFDYNLISISAIINSKLINFFYDTKFKSVKKLFPKIPIQNLKLLPLPSFVKGIDTKIKEKTELFLSKKKELLRKRNLFTNYITSKDSNLILQNKLRNWQKLEFVEFIKEINKAIKKAGGENLTKIDEIQWMEVFETKKAEAQSLKSEINKTDKEIDQMVYELYGLSEEEVKIVESG